MKMWIIICSIVICNAHQYNHPCVLSSNKRMENLHQNLNKIGSTENMKTSSGSKKSHKYTLEYLYHHVTSESVASNNNVLQSYNSSPKSKMKLLLLPPKLYLVVFYQVSLLNRTKMICSDFRRPSKLLLGSACCTISHVHTPWESCNKMF